MADRQRKYTDQVLTDLAWEQPLGEGTDSTLTARIYYDALNSRFEDRMDTVTGLTLVDGLPTLRSRPNTPQQFDNTQRSLGGQLQHRWGFAPSQTLVYGVDYRRTQNRNVARNLVDGSASASYDAELSQGAVFGQYLWDFLPGSTLQVGLRQEFASLSRGSQTVPAVGLKVGLGDTTLRANYTRNFRVPNAVNLFSVDPTNIGNPDLKPEVGDSYDVGFDQKLGDIGLLRFTYFVNDIADLIAFESIFPAVNGVSGTYTNLGRVRTTGFEVALNAEIAPNLRVGVNYTNTDPRITEDRNPNRVGRELRFAGADFLNFSLAYDNPSGWYSALWLRSVAGYPTNNANTESLAGYTTVDFRWRVPWAIADVVWRHRKTCSINGTKCFPAFPTAGGRGGWGSAVPSEVRLIQVSDLHLGSTYFPTDASWQRVLARVQALGPDGVVCTGDLTDDGQPQDWARAIASLSTLTMPWYWVPGNHDRLARKPQAVGLGNWRLFLLDSTTPNSQRGEGAIGRSQLMWLQRELARMAEPWALLAWHHHPIPFAGELAWLNEIALTDGDAVGVGLQAFPQVKGLMFGHSHREVATQWGDLPVWGCPSTGYQVSLPSDPPTWQQPGLREWCLYPDGTLQTWVHRVAFRHG
ncbi:MAG: TonB-dependent receptor [Oscillatoriales cyanobacterium SM2_1_8]|nr:TonB-dependent receptor [Oscillatoriales cyanobacterium SM2_1_8]